MIKIVSHLPKRDQPKARLLVSHLKNNPDLIVNDRQELVYKGESIPNSNITDLVLQYVKPGIHGATPVKGWKEFGSGLLQHNVPRAAIGNKVLLGRVNDDDEEGEEEDVMVSAVSPRTSTPHSAAAVVASPELNQSNSSGRKTPRPLRRTTRVSQAPKRFKFDSPIWNKYREEK